MQLLKPKLILRSSFLGMLFLCKLGFSQSHIFYENGFEISAFNLPEKFHFDFDDIWKDEHGQLWMLSMDKIIRYDGLEYEIFMVDHKNASYNVGRQYARLKKDSKGNLWISSHGGGVVKYTPGLDKYERVRVDSTLEVDGHGTEIIEDDYGNLWIGYSEGLLRVTDGEPFGIEKIQISGIATTLQQRLEELGLTDNYISSIQAVANNQTLSKKFYLEEAQNIVLLAQGELKTSLGEYHLPINEWADYAWISDEQGNIIWEMNPEKGTTAGRLYKSRLIIDSIKLTAGVYMLNYKSNERFAYGDWSMGTDFENNFAPEIPEWWGIQLFKADKKLQDLIEDLTTQHQKQKGFRTDFSNLFKDTEGNIWVFGLGLQKLMVQNDNTYIFEDIIKWRHYDQKTPMAFVLGMQEKDKENLWLSGLDEKGETVIGYLNKRSLDFTRIKVDLPSFPGSRALNHVYDQITQDSAGNIWIGGLYAMGLHRISPPFFPYDSSENPDMLSFNFMDRLKEGKTSPIYGIKTLELDDMNNLWISTWRNYFYKLNLNPSPVEFIDLKEHIDNIPTPYMYTKSRELWISVPSRNSLLRYKLETKKLDQYEGDFHGQEFDDMGPLVELPDGKILFAYASEENMIHAPMRNPEMLLFDPKNQEVSIIPKEEIRYPYMYWNLHNFMVNDTLLFTNRGQIVNIQNWTVAHDLRNHLEGVERNTLFTGREVGNGEFWAIRQMGHMGKFDISADSLKMTELIEFNEINTMDVVQDSEGNTWVAGYQLRTNLNSPEFKTIYSEKDGLDNIYPSRLYPDANGNIWLFNRSGISRFDPSTYEIFYPYQSSHLVAWDMKRSDQGEVFIKDNTTKGIYILHPDKLEKDHSPPRVLLEKIQAGGENGEESLDLYWNANNHSKEFSYSHRNISIHYSGIQLNDPEGVSYAYRLEGSSEDWVDVGKERVARFLNLSPGTYTFSLKAANTDGFWSAPQSMSFTILPPWWLSVWAKGFYYLLGIGAVVGFFVYMRQRVLEKELKLQEQQAQLEKEQALNYKLQQTDKLKDEFLANTSHELRTPLNGIIGLVDSLLDGVAGPMNAEAVDNLSLISSSGKRLSNLVNDILDFSRIRNQDLQLNMKAVDLYSITDVVLNLSQPLIQHKQLSLVNHLSPGEFIVWADENRLQQILHNLVGNAIKFTEEGKVEISAKAEGDEIQFRVSDTGIGIPKEKQEVIFHSFEQGDGSTAREYGGTGLGLAVTRQLVELHGGEIGLESEVGKGSIFFFNLQKAAVDVLPEAKAAGAKEAQVVSGILNQGREAEELEEQAEEKAEEQVAMPLASKVKLFKVLIVDDEAVNLKVLDNHLSQEEFEVVQAGDGYQALEILRRDPGFDLIILDIMMPRMSGYEVCEKLRDIYKPHELPVVMLTAKNRVSDLVAGFGSGANDYLTKPFSKEELLSRIRTHLELSQISKSYGRFVPHDFLNLIGKESIIYTQLGDQTAQEMTVMFADIRSYTSLSERMTPADNFRFINAYLKRVGPLIQENGGFVNQYYGDGIMALFKGSAQQALQAGIQMQQAIYQYNLERISKGRNRIKVGIGIHSGDLMLGVIGDQSRHDTGVISDSVNTTARLEGLTKIFNSSLILSEESLKECTDGGKGEFSFRFLGKVQVKGRKQEVGIYECLNAEPEEVLHLKRRTQADFDLGLNKYFNREFSDAAALFKQVLSENPEDLAARHYLEKAAAYIVSEPDSNWQGITILDKK